MSASGGAILLGLTALKDTRQQIKSPLNYWTLKLGVFALRDRLRPRRKYTIVCLSAGRLQPSSSGGDGSGSGFILKKAEVKTPRFEINTAAH